jgi:chorismate mutase
MARERRATRRRRIGVTPVNGKQVRAADGEPALKSRVARLRSQLDVLDLRLLEVLAERSAVVRELAAHKHSLGIPLYDPKREGEMAEAHARWAERLDLPQQLVSDVFRLVLQASRELQANLSRGTAQMKESSAARMTRA